MDDKKILDEVEEEFTFLKRGTAEIISETDLKNKLFQSKKEKKPLKIKLGMDPTAPHVHLGFAVVLRKLRQFQDLGHTVLLLIGDFTARIGDPTEKSITRKMLSPQEIEENARTYIEQFGKILDPEKTEIVYNSRWLRDMNLEKVVELTSKYTIARILERDDFEKRYKGGIPIGVHEFLYPLLQGYDSVVLKADVEMGGTDQKFNILVGRELQKEYGQNPQVVFLMPILEGLDGIKKMSKSLGNYVGITEPPKEIYGKIMSIPDRILLRYFELTTDVPLEEISNIKAKLEAGEVNPKLFKQRLAREIIGIYHDENLAIKAEAEFEKVFSKKELPSEISEKTIFPEDIKDGRVWVVTLLLIADLCESKRDARRFVSQGSVKVNGKKINDENMDVPVEDGMVVQVGSRNFAKIRIC